MIDFQPESDIAGDHEVDGEPKGPGLADVHQRAMTRFDSVAVPQQQLRAQSLEDRRFVTIPGAMWETSWSAEWADSAPKPEVDKISTALRKIQNDYRQNRMMTDYRPADDKADGDTAQFLNGLYRADLYACKGGQAHDNAFWEALVGGFGAWRMSTDYADPYDPDSDHQRILPALTIPDADQRVYFDPASVLYDKSDAKWAFIVTADPRATAAAKWGEENLAPWPLTQWPWAWDWYRVYTVQIAEYYEVEEASDRLHVFSNRLTGDEQRFYADEMGPGDAADLKAQGWTQRTRSVRRRRVRKYILNGSTVLRDCGYIAGGCIPIMPVYGNRAFVDGMERWWGYTRKRVDVQRIFNSAQAGLLEIDSLAPFERPIFDPTQMTGNLPEQWAMANINRSPYLLVNALRDETGNIVRTGALDKVMPPQIPPVKATLLQTSLQMLVDEEDNADQVKANVSAEAMDIAAQRVDEKSGLYLDNMNQSIQREGEIYLAMARAIYVEDGRKVDTVDVDGNSEMATLKEPVMDKGRVFRLRNDLSAGRYKVIASVEEATATKRDKAVRSSLSIAEIAIQAQAMDIAQACLLNAIENNDGDGMQKLQQFAHKRAVSIGLDEPTEQEKQELAQAQSQQQAAPPDPASAALLGQAQQAAADAKLSEAKAVQVLADAALKHAQADTLEKAPKVPTGLATPPPSPAEQMDQLASARLKTAQADKLAHDASLADRQHAHEVVKTSHAQAMAERQQAQAEQQQPDGGQ